MKKDISVRAGVVLQLTLIAVGSLSLLALFSLRVIGITLERRHAEAAVSVAEVVRHAVAAGGEEGTPDPVGRLLSATRRSPYIQEVQLLPEMPAGSEIRVAPAGERTAGLLSIHSTVDVTLPLVVPAPGAGEAGGSVRGLRVRFHSPGIEREADSLVRVAALLLGADVIALVAFGFFLMDRSVIGPVRRLAAVSEKIASGALDLRAEESPANEVGQLGASFNRMVAAISEAQESARTAREEAFRSEKLATVGRLAAGVAHEVGNPLMAVRGYAEYLRKNRPPEEEQDECLEKILAETRKIEAIVRGLLSAASPERQSGGRADVNAVLRETVEILSFRKMFREVEVRVEQGEVPPARIHEERFRQVLLNLMINAVDAMERGGTLVLRSFAVDPWSQPVLRGVRRRLSDPPDTDYSHLRSGVPKGSGGVGVSVEDTGRGIPRTDLQNVFDPFFTSKEPGKGTGLGLYLSRAIVETAGGEIRCESEEGKGTRFTVILPVAAEAAADGAPGKEGPDG